jgi:hypothetical protein
LSSRDPVIRTEAINSFREAGSEGVVLLVKFVRNHILNSTAHLSMRRRWFINASTIAIPILFFYLIKSSFPIPPYFFWLPTLVVNTE